MCQCIVHELYSPRMKKKHCPKIKIPIPTISSFDKVREYDSCRNAAQLYNVGIKENQRSIELGWKLGLKLLIWHFNSMITTYV